MKSRCFLKGNCWLALILGLCLALRSAPVFSVSLSLDLAGTSDNTSMTTFCSRVTHKGMSANDVTIGSHDRVSVTVHVETDTDHVGKVADILMLASYRPLGGNPVWFVRNGSSWVPFTQTLPIPVAYTENLQKSFTIPVIEAAFGSMLGQFTIFVGYRLPEGIIALNSLDPVRLTVSSDPEPKTTVLVYMEGTDLEQYRAQATRNIQEMLAAAATDSVKVVLATGAANKAVATDPVKSWKTVKRHLIRQQTIIELQDLGQVDMGDPAVVTEFIAWAQTTYPADRYLLVFWDHGGGALLGFGGYKEVSTQWATTLPIHELQRAVQDAVSRTGKRFEVIGFDACLMATVEVAYMLKDLSAFLAASEETEPGTGWDWKAFLDFTAAFPRSNGAGTGRAIADSYLSKMQRSQDDADITFSVVDLSKLPSVASALASLASFQQEHLTDAGLWAWNILGLSRSRGLDFYNREILGLGSDMVDLLDMVEWGWPFWQAQYNALRSAILDAVVYKVAGPLREAATGLSVMFPTTTVWNTEALRLYASFPFVPEYQTLVASYSDFARSNVPDMIIQGPVRSGNYIKGTISPPLSFYDQAYVAMTNGQNAFYGHQPMWRASGNDEPLEYEWDGSWYTLNGVPVSVLYKPDPLLEPEVELTIPLVVKSNIDKSDGFYYVRYNYVTGVTKEQGFVPLLNNQPSSKMLPLEPGWIVCPLVYAWDDDKASYQWALSSLEFSVPESGLVFAKSHLPSGSYNLVFNVFDLRMKPFFSSSVPFSK